MKNSTFLWLALIFIVVGTFFSYQLIFMDEIPSYMLNECDTFSCSPNLSFFGFLPVISFVVSWILFLIYFISEARGVVVKWKRN